MIEGDVGVDLRKYRYFSEHNYVATLCGLLSDTLSSLCGRYTVHMDALLGERAIFPGRCFLENRPKDEYSSQKIRLKRRMSSVLSQFVPFHFMVL